MHDFYAVSRVPEILPQLFSNHHRTMLPTCATHRDRQIALAFMNVVRKQEHQQIRDPLHELAGLGKRADISRNLRVASGQRPEFWNEMWVRQKADVKHQVSILGHTFPKSEAYARNQQALLRRLLVKTLFDVRAQLVDVEL